MDHTLHKPGTDLAAGGTHTHTHPVNGPFSGTTRVSRYQKGKTSLDFTEARDSEWQWHQMAAAAHCQRLCFSHGCGTSVEQSARIRHGINVAAHVQATPEDCTVREKLLITGCFRRLEHLPSHVILFAFNFVQCPCSCSDIIPP